MANVVITLKVMPSSPEVDLEVLKKEVEKKIRSFAELSSDEEVRITVEPVAFGLKALIILFVMNEMKGSTEPLEKEISGLDNVNSVEVIDVRRTVG